jgi:hypothetical protein
LIVKNVNDFTSGEICRSSQETQTDLLVTPLQKISSSEDSETSSSDYSEGVSTDFAEMAINPDMISDEFAPRYDSFGGFFVNDNFYFKRIEKIIEKSMVNTHSNNDTLTGSIVFANFESVNPLTRVEFLSPEFQLYLKNGTAIKTFEDRDLIFEDRKLNMESCKKIVMSRRDFFFCSNAVTRGDLFLLNELQNRSLVTTFCRTPGHDITKNLRCDDLECVTTGPCLVRFGVLDLHNYSR